MSKLRKGSLQMKDKFRGCLVGALLGDCLGAPFEGRSLGPIAQKQIESTIGLGSKKVAELKPGTLRFTDDFAMTKCLCKSLLTKKCFDASDMISTFLHEYKKNRNRGYGSGMFMLFDKWDNSDDLHDPFLPARQQFSGSGSYGNGAAMRVAPVSLFTDKEEEVIELAKSTALLTHSHKHGYNGAILQAIAIHKALFANNEVDKLEFVKDLRDSVAKLEDVSLDDPFKDDKDAMERDSELHFSRRESFTFGSQLEKLEKILNHSDDRQPNKLDADDIVRLFGNDISAQQAVPAAICTFVKCLHLNFPETLLSAFSLGGDTDTIGTMTGALAGTYFGYSSIPVEWKNICEGHEDAVSFADQLYDCMFTK